MGRRLIIGMAGLRFSHSLTSKTLVEETKLIDNVAEKFAKQLEYDPSFKIPKSPTTHNPTLNRKELNRRKF